MLGLARLGVPQNPCQEQCRPARGQGSPWGNLTPALLLVPPGPLAQSLDVCLGVQEGATFLPQSSQGCLGTLQWTLAWEGHGRAGDALRTRVPTAGHRRPMVDAAALCASWDREAGFEVVHGAGEVASVRRNPGLNDRGHGLHVSDRQPPSL